MKGLFKAAWHGLKALVKNPAVQEAVASWIYQKVAEKEQK